MLVDNPQTDFSDIFNTDMFYSSSSASSSSRASSPQSPYTSTLLTPPQPPQPSSFPDFTIPSSSFFNLFDDDHSKHIDPMSLTMPFADSPYDFFGHFGGSSAGSIGPMDIGLDIDVALGIGGSGFNTNSMPLANEPMGIDPQLVGTPDFGGSESGVDNNNNNNNDDDDDDDGDDHDNDEDMHPDADISASPSTASAPSPKPPITVKSRSSSSKKTKEAEKQKEQEQERDKLTLTITPLKVGGHGKARKGTVQTGGIVKKSTSAPSSAAAAAAARDKENTATLASAAAASAAPPPPYLSSLPASAYMPTNIYPRKDPASTTPSEKDPDDDDLPQDWRPSPEVFQKMTSKEKRQLRNKISARNFRVRRKEYISTLEGDIAERDRLLDAIRTELGSTQSENYALRQEIAALKRTLLEGRGMTSSTTTTITEDLPLLGLNLPPPAPLPAQSAAAALALAQAQAGGDGVATTTTPGSGGSEAAPATTASAAPSPVPGLLTPNTQKDVSAAGSSRFWGGASGAGRFGMGLGMGVTPVHRVVLPEMSVAGLLGGLVGGAGVGGGVGVGDAMGGERKGEKVLQENMNPMLNVLDVNVPRVTEEQGGKSGEKEGKNGGGFDGYADVNPFTMKTLDAYRMHLWSKMAAQQQWQQSLHRQQQQQQQQHANYHHQQQQLTGLASSLRPSFFASPSMLGKPSSTSTSTSTPGSSPHLPPYIPSSSPPPPYQSTPGSPVLFGKGGVVEKLERERERGKEREREMAAYAAAALASQTLLRKLGSAFWDAFSGGSTSSSSSSLLSLGGVGVGSESGGKMWDAEKVRRVLEGTAVVRVVDVEPSPQQQQQQHLLRQQVQQPQMVSAPSASASVGMKEGERVAKKKGECAAKKCCAEILEESMRSLSISKKA